MKKTFNAKRSAYVNDNLSIIDVDGPGSWQEIPSPPLTPHFTCPSEEVSLSEEQEHILGQALKGGSLFFTGSAGV